MRLPYYLEKECNEGSIMFGVLAVLVALTLSVSMAMQISLSDSKIMRNNREYRDNILRAETGISVAAESHRNTWLTDTSVLFDMNAGNAEIPMPDINIADENGNPVAIADCEIARLEDHENDPVIDAKLAEDALTRELFSMTHVLPPAIGSGMSPKDFEARRYGIRSTAIPRAGNGTLILEVGASKFFNKFNS